MGTMIERIQLVDPTKLLSNMVRLFANAGNTLPPSNLPRPFGARYESTALRTRRVLNPKKNQKQRLAVEELRVLVLHPKFLQGICIRTHPCNLRTHTVGLTPFHPPLPSRGPKRGRKCYVTPAFLGIPKQGGGGGQIIYGFLTPAFSGAQKRAEMLCRPCIVANLQTKGDKIRIGCLTPAFSGVPKKRDKIISQKLR